jgi:hypothetical protein
MLLRDFHNLFTVKYGNCLTQTNSSAAITSEIIDRANYEGVEFLVLAGTLTDANATFLCSMEHGDDSALSDTADAAAYLVGTIPSFTYANDGTAYKVGYIGPKRYVRLTVTPTGNDSGAAPIAIAAILVHPRVVPAS